ncbi:MAG: ATP-dependent Clp protease adaptor ClpS [Bacteroidetes bacterium]|nr:ATP-dependent Clp protease adaptor ClpS [Bacteroidota bacterium]
MRVKEKAIRRKKNIKTGDKVSLLVLYNDNFNTFDHVIKALVEVCGHDYIQAEQCALIVHYRGSYEIKSGTSEILAAMSRSLNARGLNSLVVI